MVPGSTQRATMPPAVSWTKMAVAPRPGRIAVTARLSATRRMPASGIMPVAADPGSAGATKPYSHAATPSSARKLDATASRWPVGKTAARSTVSSASASIRKQTAVSGARRPAGSIPASS